VSYEVFHFFICHEDYCGGTVFVSTVPVCSACLSSNCMIESDIDPFSDVGCERCENLNIDLAELVLWN
jgi:hypothetical protein